MLVSVTPVCVTLIKQSLLHTSYWCPWTLNEHPLWNPKNFKSAHRHPLLTKKHFYTSPVWSKRRSTVLFCTYVLLYPFRYCTSFYKMYNCPFIWTFYPIQYDYSNIFLPCNFYPQFLLSFYQSISNINHLSVYCVL